MEIDIVVEIETNVISKLIKLFPNNIFFDDEILKNKEEKKEETNNEKITLVAEIARNIIDQGTEKLKQIIKYAEFISILNLYKDNMSEIINSEVLNSIFNYCKMSETTEKVFGLITSGDYPILKFVLNDILKVIFEKKNDINDIKEFIKNKIINNPEFHKRIEEKGIKSIEEKIYDIYLMFDTLKQNKIKFFVLYIGDINQNFYQQNLLCNIFFNKNQKENKEIEKVFSSLKHKYKLEEIKLMNKRLKNIISSFNGKIDSITEGKFALSNKNIESSIQKILNLFNENIIKYKKLEDKIKLDFVFNFLGEKDQSTINKYNNLAKYAKFINSIKINFIKNEMTFVNSFMTDLAAFIEPTTFKIYVIDIQKDQIKTFISNAIILKGREPYNVRYIFYRIDNEQYKIDFNESNFQKIFDTTFININKYILEEIDNFKKHIKYSYKKNPILTKDSLINKLKDEFNILNIQDEANTLFEIIKNFNYKPDEEQYKALITYFEEAFKLIEKDSKLITEKEKILYEKISKLFENIIMSFINGKVYQNLKEQLMSFIKSLENNI